MSRKSKGKAQEDRRIIQAYLSKALQEMGYGLSKFLSGLKLSVSLRTRNTFVDDSVYGDTLILQLVNDTDLVAHRKMENPDPCTLMPPLTIIDKVANVADPECAEKVARYVANYHIALLQGRLDRHETYRDKLQNQIALIKRNLNHS